jgi:hypothetical protein
VPLTLPFTGLTQCLQVNSAGQVSGTASGCGSATGGSGTVTASPAQSIAYYPGPGSTAVVQGNSSFLINTTTGKLFTPNLVITSVTGPSGSNECLNSDQYGNVGGTGAPCGSINSSSSGPFAYYATNGSTLSPQSSVFWIGASTQALSTPNINITAVGVGCLSTASGGAVSASGASCGSTVTQNQYDLAYYAISPNGSQLTGNNSFHIDPNISNTSGGPGRLFAPSVQVTNISGTQCLQSSGGLITGTGAACAAGSATIGSGSAGSLPYYAAAGTALTASNITGAGGFYYVISPGAGTGGSGAIQTNDVQIAGRFTVNPGIVQLYRCLTAGTGTPSAPAGTVVTDTTLCATSQALKIYVP